MDSNNIDSLINELDSAYKYLESINVINIFNTSDFINNDNQDNNNKTLLTTSQTISHSQNPYSDNQTWKKHKRTTSDSGWCVSKVPLKTNITKQRSLMGKKIQNDPQSNTKNESRIQHRDTWCIRESNASGEVPKRTPERKRSKIDNNKTKHLSVTIISAENIPKQDVISPYVVVYLEEDLSFKSRIKYNSYSPLWNETFEFDLLPDTSNTLSIILYNHLSNSNQQPIGYGNIHLQRNVSREECIWVTMDDYTLSNISPPNTPTIDPLQIQIKYSINELDTKCEPLVSLLLNDKTLALAAYFVIENTKQEHPGFSLVELFHSQKSARIFLVNIINHPKSLSALLDSSSVLRKMIGIFCKYSRDEYIEVLQPILSDIELNNIQLEVRMQYLKKNHPTIDSVSLNAVRHRNKTSLIKYTGQILELINNTIHDIITDIRIICQNMYNIITDKDSLREILADILFQKYLCPVIAAPTSFGLLKDNKTISQSNIILAKVLTNIAMGKLYPETNELSTMNDTILQYKSLIDSIFNKLSIPNSQFQIVLHSKKKRELFRKHLETLYCVENLEFWEDVQQYKAMNNPDDRKQFASVIYKLYLILGAERQVNIDYSTLNTIKENIHLGNIDIFDNAIKEVLSLLEYDSFHKFITRKSTIFKKEQLISSKIRTQCFSDTCKFFLENRGTIQQYIDNNNSTINLKNKNSINPSIIKLNHVLDTLSFEYNPYKDVKVLNRTQKWVGKLPRAAWNVASSLLESIILLYRNHFGVDGAITDNSINKLKKTDAFIEFENETAELQNVKVHNLSNNQRLSFWVNIFNLLTLHAYISIGQPNSKISWIHLQAYSCYEIDNEVYTLLEIEHCVLRAAMSSSKWIDNIGALYPKKFSESDPRYTSILSKPIPYLCFLLCNGAAYQPILRIYYPGSIQNDLKLAVTSYIITNISIIHPTKEIRIPKLLKWYGKDIATEKRKVVRNLVRLYPSGNEIKIQIKIALKSHQYRVKYNNQCWKFLPIFDIQKSNNIN